MLFQSQRADFSTPQVMGILNVTPDSFSDGGRHNRFSTAIEHVHRMVEAGARFIDVGGESTRPGAPDVSEDEELERVIPVVEALAGQIDAIISVDTSKARVMHEAVKAGAGLINDVRALQEDGALDVAASTGVPVCLMHMQGQPRTMQAAPLYNDVVSEVQAFLLQRVDACIAAGIPKQNIILDPGYGFGKSLDHNYQLVNGLPAIISMGFPVLVGMSRKSMIGNLLNRGVEQRLAGSVALATIAASMGAHIIRVHDVKETVDAVTIVNKLNTLK
ncbi:dihydropteroate synthase [Alteromonas aestuariivivens]|uniref:Dihydropteroate synthase n=1 Tax=Alteromonas aestuariivivens TaxID=1938339 RepID=A0A3D8M979_9ALTE|nr:dihydropteroate synthase [Alteromonas aestuariivivens]RDV26203.1 dihydropteroate synthase [Alteromonas aestuariivivens]